MLEHISNFIAGMEWMWIIVIVDLKLRGPLKLVAFFGKAKIQKGFVKIMDEFAKIAEK